LYREGVSIYSLKVLENSIKFIRDNDKAYFVITFIQHEDSSSSAGSNSESGGGSGSSSDSGSQIDVDPSSGEDSSSSSTNKIVDNHDN